MYLHAWKSGLKTTYYLRSRPATRINQTTTAGPTPAARRLTAPARGARCRHRPGRSATRRPWPARSRTPRPARPATDADRRGPTQVALAEQPLPERDAIDEQVAHAGHRPHRHPRPGLQPHAAADALPGLSTRCTATPSATPGRSRRSTSPTTWSTCTASCCRPSSTSSTAWSPSSPPATRSCPTTSCSTSTSTSTPRGAACTCRASCSKRRQHVQFYLTLLDNYIPDLAERDEAFAAIENIPSIRRQGRVLLPVDRLDPAPRPPRDRGRPAGRSCSTSSASPPASRACSSSPRSRTCTSCARKGRLNGLAAGTNWVFRDESAHMNFAFAVVDTVRARSPTSSTTTSPTGSTR